MFWKAVSEEIKLNDWNTNPIVESRREDNTLDDVYDSHWDKEWLLWSWFLYCCTDIHHDLENQLFLENEEQLMSVPMILSSVLFPLPDLPTITTHSPW